MSVGPTEAVPAAALAGLVTPTASSGTSEDQQLFLELLVAQMRYQDPLNPTDSTQFLTQTAQFTSLEKMQDVADRVGLMLNAQVAFGASSMLGQQVTHLLPDGGTATGTVGGVTFGADGPVLDVAGTAVPIGDVLSLGAATSTDAATDSPAPDTGTPAAS